MPPRNTPQLLMVLAATATILAAKPEDQTLTLTPSAPNQSADFNPALFPGESVNLTVQIQDGAVKDKHYALDGKPTVRIENEKSLWVQKGDKNSTTQLEFEALNIGHENEKITVAVKAIWKTQPSGGGGGDTAEDKIEGLASGTAYTQRHVFSWQYDQRLQFADGESLIRFTVSASVDGSFVDLAEYDVQGREGWDITQRSDIHIHGMVRTETASKDQLSIHYNNIEQGISPDEIAFANFDLAIAKHGNSENLAEDRMPHDQVAAPPHEMNPGGIVITSEMSSANRQTRTKLTLTAFSKNPGADIKYVLSKQSLDKAKVYESPTGGDAITLPKEYSSSQLGNSKTLYIESEPFKQDDGAQEGTLTLEYFCKINGLIEKLEDQVKLTLVGINITGHKRGTMDSPGAVSPHGAYGKETVLLENADRDEENPNQRDLETATLNKATDDDLVKIVLTFPKNLKPSGVKLKLKHEGMRVNGEKKTFDSAVTKGGSSRLNFYDVEGNKLTDADLKIDDLFNPGNGYMSKILKDGTLTLFIEGADDFGAVGTDDKSQANAKLMGGALLTLEITSSGGNSESRLLVFRGGFFRYTHRENEPGETGVLEFFDGKGRISKTTEDIGTSIKKWTAKSGLPGGADYDVKDGGGHTPPGWWLLYKRDAFDETSQKNQEQGTGDSLVVQQGSYCRWYQDDNAPHYTAFSNDTGKLKYRYQQKFELDRNIGKPALPEITTPDGQTIMFKFQMSVIPPTSPANRTNIQIHPDGWKNGTSGCIGIQSYEHCKEAYRYLNDYHGMKIKVELN